MILDDYQRYEAPMTGLGPVAVRPVRINRHGIAAIDIHQTFPVADNPVAEVGCAREGSEDDDARFDKRVPEKGE